MISGLLYVVGALVFLAGMVALGFGTPASALDFGNTLIVAGTTAGCGGLIVIGLAAVIARLQRIADNVGTVIPAHPDYGDTTHVPAATHPAPPPPPKIEPKVEPQPFEPRGPSEPPAFPPSLPVAEKEDAAETAPPVPSETREPEPVREAPRKDMAPPVPPAPEPEPEPVKAEAAVLPPKSFFDSVWPEEKTLEPAAFEPPAAPEPPLPPPPPTPPPPEVKRRPAAILKSGVVDGMAYTLYVDGSIEAELPQGTLHFASIHELRAHLENKQDE